MSEAVDSHGIVTEILENFDCQPVLFVGAGLARRYIGAPDWTGALQYALGFLGKNAPDYSYLIQKHDGNMVAIGTHVGDLIFEWAWSDGKDHFAEELFSSKDRYIFIKALITRHLTDITPDEILPDNPDTKKEIEFLSAIRPHAIITTNYDRMLEAIFVGYEGIVGKGVLRYDINSFGEIFHIHGSVDDPTSLVVTKPDYDNWHEESRYFAAKLLTYFVEHPVFIFGYGLGDPNVQTVLRDIGRIAADESGLINNVVQVVWHEDPKLATGPSEFVIADSEKQYRLRVLNVSSLSEIFENLSARHELKQINPAVLRALSARLMKLTRKDIPSGEVQIDYATLERVIESHDEIPKMLGITFADSENKSHPFTLSLVADQLDMKGWQQVDKLIKRIKEENGFDQRSSDNRYHCKIKTGKKDSSAVHKWSHEAIELFGRMRDGKDYNLKP